MRSPRSLVGAFSGGTVVGTFGGLIGLGGAEFRLPLLLGPFGLDPLPAVILNKAMSLVVVTAALPIRAATVPWGQVLDAWPIILNLLAGSLLGAWSGASIATKIPADQLRRLLAVLLVLIAGVLLVAHAPAAGATLLPMKPLRIICGIVTGYGIGVVAAFMGVAGGELLIPTLVLLFGVPLKLAGSLSLVVSLPTMVVGFARYSQDRSFSVLRTHALFGATMAIGSIAGAFIGGRLLGVVPSTALPPALAVLLVISAYKVWTHAASREALN